MIHAGRERTLQKNWKQFWFRHMTMTVRSFYDISKIKQSVDKVNYPFNNIHVHLFGNFNGGTPKVYELQSMLKQMLLLFTDLKLKYPA